MCVSCCVSVAIARPANSETNSYTSTLSRAQHILHEVQRDLPQPHINSQRNHNFTMDAGSPTPQTWQHALRELNPGKTRANLKCCRPKTHLYIERHFPTHLISCPIMPNHSNRSVSLVSMKKHGVFDLTAAPSHPAASHGRQAAGKKTQILGRIGENSTAFFEVKTSQRG